MVKNLTPHPLTFVATDGAVVLTVAPEATPARVSELPRVVTGTLDGVPVYSAPSYGAVTGLPAPEAGVVFVVSLMVAQATVGRDDVYVVAETVRDASGRIVGARGISRLVDRPDVAALLDRALQDAADAGASGRDPQFCGNVDDLWALAHASAAALRAALGVAQ